VSGFTGRTHTPESKSEAEAAARCRSAGPRAPISEATRLKMRLAKVGGRHSPEHKAKIAEAMRRSWVEAGHRDIFKQMTAEQHEDYRILRSKGGFSRAEALRSIGRADLVEA
jgi:hypothetical protein